MNREEFISYISHPENLGQGSLDSLQEIVAEYSYFQTAHLLLLKNLYNLGSIRFSNQLKYSSVFAGDRQLLFHLLHDHDKSTSGKDGTSPGGYQETEEKKVVEPSGMREDAEASSEILSGQVEQRLTEIQEQKSGEIAAEASGQTVPEQSADREESVADRILREVAEARSRMQEPDRVSQDELTQVPEEMKKDGEQTTLETEVFTLDDNTEDLPESELSEIPPGPETKMSGVLLEIDEGEGLTTTQQEKKNGQPDKHRPAEPGNAEKKTADLIQAQRAQASESHTFSQWIELLDSQPPVPVRHPEDERRKSQGELIDKFIQENPRIAPGKADMDEEVPDFSENSVQETESLFTDTLAQIYIRQGYYSKAIFAYEKLSLKFPEKSSYFATQIEKIRELINKKSKQ